MHLGVWSREGEEASSPSSWWGCPPGLGEKGAAVFSGGEGEESAWGSCSCPEAEEAQEAACPLSLGPVKRGLLSEVLVTWHCKHWGCTQQLSSASS